MLTTVEGIYENGMIRLLEPVPGVVRARVVVTVLPDQVNTLDRDSALVKSDDISLEKDQMEEDFNPKSELGKQLWEIRQRAIAKGMKLLSQDEILEEVRRRRGELDD
jgi:hypothetical protein